jgi:FkbM family methyltransferase
MKNLKKIIHKLLSQRAYLRTLHRSFYFLFDLGLLKKDARFKYHYMVNQLIEPTFSIVDIGANLGYFSKNFARLAKKGNLVSIEPIPVFYETLTYFLKKYAHATLHNVALGTEEGSITMVMPESNGMIRTGLPHIAESEEEKKQHATQEVRIVKGSELLGNLEKLDYIKCDIEGYEWHVFQEIKPILEKHQPFVQVEISEKNLAHMLDLFQSLGYTQFGIHNFHFIEEQGKQVEEGDFFFVPANRLQDFKSKFKPKNATLNT